MTFDALARHILVPDAEPACRRELERLAAADLRRAWIAASLKTPARIPARPLAPAAVLKLAALVSGRPATLKALVATGGKRSLGGAPSGTALKNLARAKRMLRRVWPEQAAQTSWYLRRIVFVGKGGFEGTIPELPGFSFFRSAESWSGGKVGVVSSEAFEFLLHESAHQQLLLLGRAFPLWESEYRTRFVSPWSGETRKAIALPAALHAYWITLEGLRRAGGADSRVAALRRGFAPGFALARRHMKLTDHGRRFLELLEAKVGR